MEKITTKGTIIALILTLIFATTFVSLPLVSAHDPPLSILTYSYLSVVPNPVGINQPITIIFWLDKVPPTAMGAYGDRWHGLTIEVTKPDGSKQTLGPFTSDPVGSSWAIYTPDQLGKYYFQFSFPGQTLAGENLIPTDTRGQEYIGDYFEPSTSPEVELTVQQEPIVPYPENPLPEDYWERPISYENREWWSISGNWLMGRSNLASSAGPFNPYTTAPNTAHIVWTKELTFGGIMGGDFGSTSYYTGMTYESKFTPPVIMNGRLYYNDFPSTTRDSYPQGIVCVDLRTGEELWRQSTTTSTYEPVKTATGGLMYPCLTLGQIYDCETPNQHGGIPYLWSIHFSNYYMYDAFTGRLWLTLENASTGTVVFSPVGDMLVYVLNAGSNWLAMWNSSKIADMWRGLYGTDAWQWRPPYGATLDWRDGIQWNVTIPDVAGSQSINLIGDGVIIASVSPADTSVYPHVYVHVAYDATTGKQMWVENRTQYAAARARVRSMLDGVYIVYDDQALDYYGYDIYTGKQLWGPVKPPDAVGWDMYTHAGHVAAWGKFFGVGYGGIYAFDIKTGTSLWRYSSGSSGLETPYGTWPFWWHSVAAEGKIFSGTGEHSPSMPLLRGEQLHAIDAETGERVWSIKGWYQTPSIAEGYLVTFNHGDNRIYIFGKGLSATTVTAAPKVIAEGSYVLIEGTVTDQSPGDTCLGVPAAGTPAIADTYMTEWMEYLYMQQPCPDYAKGVEVILETLDPNGNFYEIGTVTSDASGVYKLMWEPPVPGEYTIIATFAGSESYYRSYAETSIGVTEAPSPAGPIQPEPTEPAEAPLITIEMAILLAAIVIAIAVLAGFYIIRKRK